MNMFTFRRVPLPSAIPASRTIPAGALLALAAAVFRRRVAEDPEEDPWLYAVLAGLPALLAVCLVLIPFARTPLLISLKGSLLGLSVLAIGAGWCLPAGLAMLVLPSALLAGGMAEGLIRRGPAGSSGRRRTLRRGRST